MTTNQPPEKGLTMSQPESTENVVHVCPLGDDALTTCCGKTPFELPRSDRITAVPGMGTCRANVPVVDPARVARYAEASTLTTEVIAAMWRGHADCTWVSTGHDVVWSCGIIHPRPIYMQPTTRDRHFAALLRTQIDADAAVADAELVELRAGRMELLGTVGEYMRRAEAAEAKVAAVEALHRPWYEVNGVRHDNLVSVDGGDVPADHVCRIGPGCDQCLIDHDEPEFSVHMVPACYECRAATEDGEPGYLLWPCGTVRALSVPAVDADGGVVLEVTPDSSGFDQAMTGDEPAEPADVQDWLDNGEIYDERETGA